jgi:Transcription antiterminator
VVKDINWYVVRTKFKCEKQVSRDLNSIDIESYVPLETRIKKYGRNKRKIEIPLISTYVFVRIGLNRINEVLKISNIREIIKFSQKPATIPEEEIELLKRITGQSKIEYNLESKELTKGDKVEIIRGSLTGLCGELVEIKGNKTVKIELITIGVSLILHVPIDSIRVSS